MRSALAIFMSHTEAITCLPQIVTSHSCKERMGDQRGTLTLTFTHVLIALMSNKALLKPRHHWTSQLIKNTKILFGVCRVNETRVTDAYLRCIGNKVFIVIYLVKQTLFLVTLIYIGTKINLAGNGECIKPNLIFIACFSPEIWLIV